MLGAMAPVLSVCGPGGRDVQLACPASGNGSTLCLDRTPHRLSDSDDPPSTAPFHGIRDLASAYHEGASTAVRDVPSPPVGRDGGGSAGDEIRRTGEPSVSLAMCKIHALHKANSIIAAEVQGIATDIDRLELEWQASGSEDYKRACQEAEALAVNMDFTHCPTRDVANELQARKWKERFENPRRTFLGVVGNRPIQLTEDTEYWDTDLNESVTLSSNSIVRVSGSQATVRHEFVMQPTARVYAAYQLQRLLCMKVLSAAAGIPGATALLQEIEEKDWEISDSRAHMLPVLWLHAMSIILTLRPEVFTRSGARALTYSIFKNVGESQAQLLWDLDNVVQLICIEGGIDS